MLTPDYLKGCPQPFVELYGELADFILGDISRRIAKAGAITDTAQWQIIRLKELGLSTKEIRQKITEINRMTLREINAAFQDAARESLEFQERIYSKAGRKAVPLAENEALQQLLDAAKRQTAGQMQNLTRSLGFLEFVNGKATFRPLAQVYQHTLDLTQMAVSSGAMDTKTAVRTAVKRLMDSGVRTVDYASGHVNHVDVAARRAIVTGVNQMSANMTDRLAEELGAEFFEVTAHAGARPSHQVWQGQVFHRGGAKDGYPDLESATGLGTVGGLCGANCRHSYFPFFPGASVRAYTPEKLKNIDPPPVTIEGKTYTFYEATQKQRSMETAMRKTKREMLGYEAAGLNEDFTSAAILLRRQQEAYNDFCRAASLRRQTDRAQVVGFSHSQSSKASWAARKEELTNAFKRDTIKSKEGDMSLEYQRYGRNKNTKTNKTYIESGEYRRKFDKMSENPRLNQAIYQAAKQALHHRNGTEFEDMYWFDPDSGKILAKETASTTKRTIFYSAKTKATVENHPGLIAMHTHPSSMPPSVSDFNSCFRNRYACGWVVCHNGTIFGYTSHQEIRETLYELYLQKFLLDGKSEYEAQVMALMQLKQNHWIDFWEVN